VIEEMNLNIQVGFTLEFVLKDGYNVLIESTLYITDRIQRPTRQLWSQPIGILEIDILGEKGLLIHFLFYTKLEGYYKLTILGEYYNLQSPSLLHHI